MWETKTESLLLELPYWKVERRTGVITDVDGIFTIQLAKNASLTISYVGYQKKTVVVKDKKFISVNLTPDRSMMLDEVVVVGLANKRKNPSWEL